MQRNLLTEGRFIDIAIVYIMAKKFILPFKKWKAYSLGLIDEKGKRTKKKAKTTEEKNSYTLLDRMIRKIRTVIGDKGFLKLTLSYLLLRENGEDSKELELLLEDVDSKKMTFMTTPVEGIVLTYKEENDIIIFFITSILKGVTSTEMTSIFGSNEIPKKGNERLLKKFSKAFSTLNPNGFEEIEVIDISGNSVKIIISFDLEFKIESKGTEDLFLGKFYSVFRDEEQQLRFTQLWRDYVREII